ncbi:oocyte zinc finger protein XlCOF22-like isoform X2 [Pelobates fuscus]|uniref:oocyte zinc finger protein XlCOF22-like isoform X2 n=1 Tax=Pelobates fuscus TaxID=191477 RepID=UPI002FE4A1BC
MFKNMQPMTERILNLTLEIIYLLTGEPAVTHSSSQHVTEGSCRTQISITVSPPHSLIHERNNDQKILELTNQIIQLLTGEVPIRCEDVTVHLSMEEWEYLEGHKDLYRDVMMENHQLLSSLDGSSDRKALKQYNLSVSGQDFLKENKSDKKVNPATNFIRFNELRKRLRRTGRDKESASREKEDHRNSGISIPSESSQTQHSSTGFKDKMALSENESFSDTNIHTPTECTERESTLNLSNEACTPCEEVQLTDTESKTLPECTQAEYPPTHIKEESVSCDNGNSTDIDNHTPTAHTQTEYTYANIKKKDGEFTDNDSNGLIDYNIIHIKEESASCQEGNLTDIDIYSAIEFTQTDLISTHVRNHNEVSSNTLEKYNNVSVAGSSNCDSIYNEAPSFSHQNPYNSERANISKSELVKHQTIHKRKRLTCSICQKNFSGRYHLIVHQRVHTGEKQFSCGECQKCFSVKSSLISHQRTHRGEKPYSCSECGQLFTAKSSLVTHQRSHTGEKPFPCSLCGKRFTRSSHLARHKTTHTREKNFLCSECGNCFTAKSCLMRHLRIHTGEKPYSCPECGKSFTQNSHLVSHRRTHRGENPFLCPIRGRFFRGNSNHYGYPQIHLENKPFSFC